MTRALVAAFAVVALVSCPASVRADEGRQVDVEQGTPAPFTGVLCDVDCAAAILKKRRAAEAKAASLDMDLKASQASEAQAKENERVAKEEAAGKPSWGALIGTTGAALVLGTVLGVVLFAVAEKK